MSDFAPNCLPLLVGSLPITDHKEATSIIFEHTPQIPIWPQLPFYSQEGMIPQFLPGMPGLTEEAGKTFIDNEHPDFDGDFLAFYEEYLLASEGGAIPDDSRFSLSRKAAQGFYDFLELAGNSDEQLYALKGQTTGPITFCTGVVDREGRAIFYNEQLRDAAVKLLTMKARWQTAKMAALGKQPIMFFDEPALAGFGSSAFITITTEDVKNCLDEVFTGVREENGLTGVHVCANTEWSVLFDAGVDIVNYDAYSYFDRFILYPDQLVAFIEGGGILATGIVPTNPESIDKETADTLTTKWLEQTAELEALGIDRDKLYAQSLITPSCGTGSVSPEQALRVLELTRDVSAQIRRQF